MIIANGADVGILHQIFGNNPVGTLFVANKNDDFYIADYIEPGRDKAKNLPVVRPLCFRDLDAALLKILSDTLDYLKSTGKEIDPLTEQTCQYYKAKAEEK